jgi:hypothetical protein
MVFFRARLGMSLVLERGRPVMGEMLEFLNQFSIPYL